MCGGAGGIGQPLAMFMSLDENVKDARLASFNDWPADLNMRPVELAEAGFYHFPNDGHADQVI